MNNFSLITPEEFQDNPFTMIGKEWMLVSAEREGVANTMTASWGGVGILWHKPVASVFIRPQRYTKEFVDANDFLSLSVLGESYRSTLSYLGKVSGRDEPKIETAGLTLRHEDGVPFFDEAHRVLICKKLFAQALTPESFIDETIIPKVYPLRDFHTMYVCEVVKILTRSETAQ